MECELKCADVSYRVTVLTELLDGVTAQSVLRVRWMGAGERLGEAISGVWNVRCQHAEEGGDGAVSQGVLC